MFYDFALTIPAATAEASPASVTMKLTAGIIYAVKLLFPPGPHGMVKLRIRHGLHQLLPTNPDGYFASDDEVINIDEYYELKPGQAELTAVGYSPGTTYPHTVAIRVGILDAGTLNPAGGIASMFSKLFRFLGLGG